MTDSTIIATRRTAGYHLRMSLASRFSARFYPVEDVLDEVVEDGGVELVDDLLAVALGQNQSGVAQLPQVPRDRRPRGGEVRRDLAGRARSIAQQAENLPTSRISEGFKG